MLSYNYLTLRNKILLFKGINTQIVRSKHVNISLINAKVDGILSHYDYYYYF